MESRIGELKNDFNNIIHIRGTVKSIFDILEQRIDKLKKLYSDFVEHNENHLFIFGLDSFRFQSKLIDIEYEDMRRLFLAISNRMYCEYFKLYKIIIDYIFQTITDKKIIEVIKINNFPIYKDLEPFKEYKFEIVLELHENILILLSSIINNIDNRENELLVYQNKKKIGLSIDNFVTSFNFDIVMMREKVILFLTYIEFFHQMHTKYLRRFSNKIQLMYTHINNDIRFDESIELNSDKQNEILSDFANNTIDKKLLTELKRSINVDTSDTESDHTGSTQSTTESIKSPSGNAHRTNSFIGFCDNHNIVLSPVPATDNMSHAFGMIESSCDSILNNDKEEIYNNLIRDTSQGRAAKEGCLSRAKMLLKEEAKRRIEVQRLDEEKKEEEEKRVRQQQQAEEAKRLEEEVKRIGEAERVRQQQQAEEAKRLEDEERIRQQQQAEEAKRLEDEERIRQQQQAEEAKRLEEETRQLEDNKRLEEAQTTQPTE